MKKIVVFIILVLSITCLLFSCTDKEAIDTNEASVSSFENDVIVLRSNEEKNITNGFKLTAGDVIRTGSSSNVVLKIGTKKLIIIPEDSEVEITKLDSNNLLINIISGEFFFDVFEKLSSTETMAFLINDSKIEIRGTSGFGSNILGEENFTILTGLGYFESGEKKLYINPYTDYSNTRDEILRIVDVNDIPEYIFEYAKSSENYLNELISYGWNYDSDSDSFIPPTDVIKDTDTYSGWKKDSDGNWYYDDGTKIEIENIDTSEETLPSKNSLTIFNNSLVYNGNNQSINVVGFDKNKMRISGNTEKNVGKYKVKITPKGKWSDGTKDAITFDWEIVKKDVTVSFDSVNVAFGSEIPLKCNVDGVCGKDQIKYSINFTETNAGIYDVIPNISGTYDNYNVIVLPGTVEIEKRKVTVKVSDKVVTYGDTVNMDATYQNLPSGVDSLKVSFSGIGKNVGVYTVTPVLGENYLNYDVTLVPGTLTINKKDVTIKADNVTYTYGDVYTLTATVTNELSTDKISYSLYVKKENYVGKQDIFVSIDSTNPNYNITTRNGVLEMTKRDVSVDLYDTTVTFGDEIDIRANFTNVNSKCSPISYEVIGYEKTVGEYQITPKITGSYPYYNIKVGSAKLTIKKKSVEIKANKVTKTYGETSNLTATENGVVDGYPISYTLECNGTDVGTYPIYVNVKGDYPNYDIITSNGEMVINKGTMELTGRSQQAAYNYSYKPSYSCSVTNGTTYQYRMNEKDPWSDTCPSFKDVGMYVVYIKAENPNYNTAYCMSKFEIIKATQNEYIKFDCIENGMLKFKKHASFNGIRYINPLGEFIDIEHHANIDNISASVPNTYTIVSIAEVYNYQNSNYNLNYIKITVHNDGSVTVDEDGTPTQEMINKAISYR